MAADTGPLEPPAAPEKNQPTKADTTAHDDKVRKWLAFYVFTGFIGYVFWVSTHAVQLPGDTLGIILGALIAVSGNVVGYYFQSSSGSTAKQVAIEKGPARRIVLDQQPEG